MKSSYACTAELLQGETLPSVSSFLLSQVALLRVVAGRGDGMQTSVIVEPLGSVRLVVDVVSDFLQVLEVRPEHMMMLFEKLHE